MVERDIKYYTLPEKFITAIMKLENLKKSFSIDNFFYKLSRFNITLLMDVVILVYFVCEMMCYDY